MTTYEDARGRKYKVMPGIGAEEFKGRWLKPEGSGWHCMAQLPWRKTMVEAQRDLDEYAKKKGWEAIK